jgi:CheY-like chemotaxis protein
MMVAGVTPPHSSRRGESFIHMGINQTHTEPAGADDDASVKAVLVVEPDPENQVELAHALRARGHRVVGTSSAVGALALVGQWPVDLVLVSQDLPGTTGVQVTEELLQHHPDLRIVVLASEGGPGLRTAALRAGAIECLARMHVMGMLTSWLNPSSSSGSWVRTTPGQAGTSDEPAAHLAE